MSLTTPRPDGDPRPDEVDEPVEGWMPRGRRTWWVAALIGLALAVGMAVWWGVSASTGRPTWVDAGFDDVTDAGITVIYDVHRETGREVVCALKAEDEHHVIVGTGEVTVPAADVEGTRQRATLRTTTRATTAYVDSCWYADEPPADR